MFNKLKISFATLIFISSAQAAPIVSYSPALSVGSLERFTVSDGGADVTANYTIQSIAADPTSGYIPRKGATLFRAIQSGSFAITYVSNVDSSTFIDTAVMTAAPAYIQLSSGSGQNASTGTALPQPIKVQVLDSSSNPISGATITWSISGSGGTFSSPSITDASGIASTTLTMGSTPGTFSVSASVGSIVLSNGINSTANPTGNQLSNLIVQTQPSNLAQQGISFSSQPVLALTNSSNAVYTTPTAVTASAFSNSSCTTPASGALSGTLSVQSSAGTGLATFTDLSYSALNPIYIKFVAGSLSACSSQVNVVQPAASATKISLNFIPTSAYTAQQFNLLANVTDSSGNIIQATSNQISLSAFSDAACSVAVTGTLSGGSAINAYQGQALFNSLIYSKAETIYLQASATGLTSACSTGIQIKSNPINTATQLAFYSQPSSELAGQVFSAQPFVIAQNSLGSIYQGSTAVPVTIAAYTNSTCSTPASGSLSGGISINTVFGVGSFTNLSYSASVTIYLGATSPGLTSSCSTAIVINPTAASLATQLKYKVAPSSSAVVNTFLLTQPIVEVDDNTGTVVSSSQGYIALSWYRDSTCSTPVSGLSETYGKLINGQAQFSFLGLSSIGTYYLRASYNNIAPACSQAISIASSLAMAPKTSTVLRYSTLQMSVIGGTSPYTFSATGGTVNSTGLFTAGATLGAATVKVTDSIGSNVTSNLTIMLSDGSLDPSFNTTGQVLSDLSTISGGASTYISPSTADVGPDGSVYLGSSYYFNSSYTTMIVKYNSAGALDSTFGSAGVLSIPGYQISKIKTSLNGDLIVGIQTSYPGPYTSILRRYTSTGTLVSTFGASGSVSFNYATNPSSDNTYVQKIVTDSSDNIYLVAYDYTGSSNEIRAIKISSSGTIVYSKSIYSLSSPSADTNSLGLAVSNGKMAISMNVYSSQRINYVYMLDSTGALDATFNSGNPLLIPATAPTTYTTYGIKANLDGSFLIFGQKDNNYPYSGIVIKVTSSGAIDTTFGTSGVLTGNFGLASGSASVQLMNTTGNKMLTTEGSGGMGSVNNAYLLRTNMDGTVDVSFNGGSAINQSTYGAGSYSLNYVDTLVGINGKITAVAYYYDPSASKYQTLISRYTSSLTNGPIPVLASSTFVWGQSQQLSGVGGTGPYTYAVASGNGTIDANGVFTAGSTSGNVVIQITDSTGATGTTNVNVIKFSIAASASKRYPGQSSTISIATGAGTAPYSYSLITNNSGGSITNSGIYTAGTTYGGSDTIKLTDASGNSNTTSIAVAKAITITPLTLSTGSTKTTTFVASGGSTAGYLYSLSVSGGIGSLVDSSTGNYVAGTNSTATPVAEQVMVIDSEGNSAYATTSVVRLSGALVSTVNYSIPASMKCCGWYNIGPPAFQAVTKKLIMPFWYYDSNYGQHGLVARMNADGSLDSTYGTANNGGYFANLNAMGDTAGWVASVQDSSGRLYILLQQSGYIFRMIRLTANGALDTTFGASGVTQYYQVSPQMNGCNTNFLKINTSGQVMMMSSCATSTDQYYMVSARLNSNGSMDNTYGTNGMSFVTDSTNAVGYPTGTSFNLLSDNSLIYTVEHKVNTTYYYGMYHINTNGTIDTTFNNNAGVVNFDAARAPVATIDASNNIYVFNGNLSYATNSITSYTKFGLINTAFGGTGTVTINGSNNITAIIPTSSYLYIGGGSTIGRLSYSGILDTTFGTAASPPVGFSTLPDTLTDLTTLPNGDLGVSSGRAGIYNVTDFKVYP